MRILVTGAAGFIGFHAAKYFLEKGHEVLGLDNINEYYDPNLKYDRLSILGIDANQAKVFNKISESDKFNKFSFVRLNLEDRKNLPKVFEKFEFDKVINLAAQAGVRYSIENPNAYIDSNIVGFANLLECCRNFKIKHLIYASSSSVYGQSDKVPFSTEDNLNEPISLYAATKRSNELMASTYSHLYDFKVTGLRFFTVYGPWGRPDMAMFLFTDAILNGKPIEVFNNGNLERDFTYIDDIVKGVYKVVNNKSFSVELNSNIYNIGNSKPIKLLDFIIETENQLGIQAEKKMLPMQPGDVKRTWADVSNLKKDYNYAPDTSLKDGIKEYVNWFKGYYV